MDNLETLLAKKQYDTVIKATEKAINAEELFYRIIAFASKEDFSNSLQVISNNRKLLEQHSLKLLIGLHIDILLLDRRFDEAYAAYDYYRELPYHSQEVEEIIREIPIKIKTSLQNQFSSKSDSTSEEDIIKMLKSENGEDVLGAISAIRELDYKKFLIYIKNILINFKKQAIRSFALLFLVEKNHDENVDFLSSNGLININPSKLVPPFAGKMFQLFETEIQKKENDVTFTQTYMNILSCILLTIFPETINMNDTLKKKAIYFLTKQALHQGISSLHQNDKILSKELSSLIEKYSSYLEQF